MKGFYSIGTIFTAGVCMAHQLLSLPSAAFQQAQEPRYFIILIISRFCPLRTQKREMEETINTLLPQAKAMLQIVARKYF
jgi:hypothetical protein